jgi:hypothetical protein
MSGLYCDPGSTCQPKLGAGAPCSRSPQCSSSLCSDTVGQCLDLGPDSLYCFLDPT